MSDSSSKGSQEAIEGMDAVLDYEKTHPDLTEAEKNMRDEELSFYTNSENEYGDDNIWGLLSGVGGNIYEWWVIAERKKSRENCENDAFFHAW